MDAIIKNAHSNVLVPIESWEYNSPYLKYLGKAADVGLFAEAFIYYDTICVQMNTPRDFEEFVTFFAAKGKVNHLIELIKNKKIIPFYYSFMSTAINNQGEFSIWNIQAPRAGIHSDFIGLTVNRANLPISSKQRQQLWKAIVENLIDENSKNYEAPVLDAKEAIHNPEKVAILVQAYYDDLYEKLQIGKPPRIKCEILDTSKDSWNIKVNVDYKILDKLTNNKLVLRQEMPLIGEVTSNRLIWTALQKGYDLFLGDVMSQVVGNKLYEAEEKINKTENIISELEERVEFPDVRAGVNSGTLTVEDILNLRIHANKFREWLQQEGDRDRDAFYAYHNEVTKASGITKQVSTILKLFGNLTSSIGAAAYPVVTKDSSPENILLAAGGAYLTGTFLKNVADSIGKEWKPVVFGEYIKKHVSQRLKA
jgi:hypothetical protein